MELVGIIAAIVNWAAVTVAIIIAVVLTFTAQWAWQSYKKTKVNSDRLLANSLRIHGDKVKNLEIERKIKGGDKSKI